MLFKFKIYFYSYIAIWAMEILSRRKSQVKKKKKKKEKERRKFRYIFSSVLNISYLYIQKKQFIICLTILFIIILLLINEMFINWHKKLKREKGGIYNCINTTMITTTIGF